MAIEETTASRAHVHGIVHRGDSVWLVGECIGDKTADVYASRKDAEDAILGYIFDDEDEHWIGKLNAEQRCILWTCWKTDRGER